uniref:Histidine acid phosphatase domain containing protein n=1 Tax=Haemonchus contortus TaxID=6289 RepID=A0A7I4Y5K2_HAECO
YPMSAKVSICSLVTWTYLLLNNSFVQCEQPYIPTAPPIPVVPRSPKPNDKLHLVQVVWRHGDRAPTMTYPTDTHQEEAWPNGWGELTELGMRQQYALGNVLRSRYMGGANPFLNRRYNSKQVYIRSTDVNRTLISAYSNIAGMFAGGEPGKDFPNETDWPTGWTPVPVHTLPGNEDHAGNVFAPCPRAEQLDDELRNSKEYKQLAKDNEDFLEYLTKNTGMKVELPNIYLINDVHYIETIYNMSQPEWMTHDVSKRLRNLTSIVNEYTYGPMLRSLVDLMNQKKRCLDDSKQQNECKWIRPLKYYAYSAHDTTVAALLSTFGDEMEVIRGGLPKYTASVAVELWSLDGEGLAVRILFHGAFHHNYHVITHLTKGCPVDKEFCPLEVFEKRSRQFMPVDMKKECERRQRSNRTNQTWKAHQNKEHRINRKNIH